MTATSTQSVHAGEARFRSHNSLTVPIVQTAVYTFDSCEALVAMTEEQMFWDEPEREEYGRYGNPTVRAAEAKLAALEGGEDAILVSSGMGAVTSLLLLSLKAGDHLILSDECYHATLDFCHNYLGRWGIETTFIPTVTAMRSKQPCAPTRRSSFPSHQRTRSCTVSISNARPRSPGRAASRRRWTRPSRRPAMCGRLRRESTWLSRVLRNTWAGTTI